MPARLASNDVRRLQAAVAREIRDGDHVRYYHLCKHCARQTVALGGVGSQPAHTTVV